MDIGEGEVDQDVVVVPEPPLVQPSFTVVTDDESTDDKPTRKHGFVPLERCEYSSLDGDIRAHASCAEPTYILQSIKEDGWWIGLSWMSVAKALFVVCRELLRDGWDLPGVFQMTLVETAMCQHDLGTPLVESGDELYDILFGQGNA